MFAFGVNGGDYIGLCCNNWYNFIQKFLYSFFLYIKPVYFFVKKINDAYKYRESNWLTTLISIASDLTGDAYKSVLVECRMCCH